MNDRPVTATQSVSATISQNASYTYSLPAGREKTSAVSIPAQHSSMSVITTDANGNSVYNYKPAANYSGTDVVVITTKTQDTHSGCHGGPGGNCNHGNSCGSNAEKTTITTINLTVTPTDQTVTKSLSSSASGNY